MDILIHTASGMLMGTTMALWNPLKQPIGARFYAASLLVGGCAGAFPDLDAISQWSGFDSTLGAWFGLAPGDDVYSGRWWYSHHAFTHSLLCSLIFAGLTLLALVCKGWSNTPRRTRAIHYAIVTALGWNAHLAGDLPTPAGSWDGIAYWWPSSNYIGGTGQTFWWNNYDVFLLLISGIFLHVMVMCWGRSSKRWLGPLSTLGVLVLIVYQLNQRPIDFNDRSRPYAERERISLDYQRNLLGDRLFGWMSALDRALPVYF
jgi:inner membrane protein